MSNTENKTIIFASGNPDKLIEVKNLLLPAGFNVLGIKDIGLEQFEVEEDCPTLEGNAEKKARALYQITNKPVFADDTGLFVPFLKGAPGVYSARYSGENATYESNRKKLLDDMKSAFGEDRYAYFKTVIAFISQECDLKIFDGVVKGYISKEETGNLGFGYDSIFYLPEKQKTFAEMTLSEKSENSHRSKALKNFKNFLELL